MFLFTQDGDHHVSSQDLYGPPGYEVEGGEDVPGVDQRVPRGSVGGLELHGQRPEAAFGGAFKSLAVLQQRPVQMETDVCLETLRETLQHLETGSEGTDGLDGRTETREEGGKKKGNKEKEQSKREGKRDEGGRRESV